MSTYFDVNAALGMREPVYETPETKYYIRDMGNLPVHVVYLDGIATPMIPREPARSILRAMTKELSEWKGFCSRHGRGPHVASTDRLSKLLQGRRITFNPRHHEVEIQASNDGDSADLTVVLQMIRDKWSEPCQ